MNTRKLFLVTGKVLISFGILSLISGIIAFFPVFSYKPGFLGWSIRLASPIWSGYLAVIAGVLIILAEKQWTSGYLWEAAFAFSIFNVISSPVQGAITMASLLLGPYCYYSFAGVSGRKEFMVIRDLLTSGLSFMEVLECQHHNRNNCQLISS
ncbi:transmembrane protein 212 isoform X2 [Crotalus tigris]|uniref:transmembrane protein 212 isoform X2 n=1 Tax=Crotalus tigris TaxID=88082 RepID=UPI00192F4E4E|nr:transmembrane protein 212 isoform X2 [Crotalus tigris]